MKKVVSHIKKHHKKYIFWFASVFTVVKTVMFILSMVWFINFWLKHKIFAENYLINWETVVSWVDVSTLYEFSWFIMSWLNISWEVVSIVDWEYAINTWNFVSDSWYVFNWDLLTLRMLSASWYNLEKTMFLKVWTWMYSFSLITMSGENETGLNITWENETGLNITWWNETGLNITWWNETGLNMTWWNETGLNITWENETGLNITWWNETGLNITWENETGLNITWWNETWLNITWWNETWLNITWENETGLNITWWNETGLNITWWNDNSIVLFETLKQNFYSYNQCLNSIKFKRISLIISEKKYEINFPVYNSLITKKIAVLMVSFFSKELEKYDLNSLAIDDILSQFENILIIIKLQRDDNKFDCKYDMSNYIIWNFERTLSYYWIKID